MGLVLFGAGFMIMVFSRSFWGFIPAGIGVGGVGYANIAIVTMRQRLAPPEMLGRVVAASWTISWSLIPLGAAIGGAMADWVGLLPVYLVGAAGVIVTAFVVARTEVWTGPRLTSSRVSPAPANLQRSSPPRCPHRHMAIDQGISVVQD